jgi:hypothetical protein
VSFAAIVLCVASRVFVVVVVVYLVMAQSGNFWIHPLMSVSKGYKFYHIRRVI